MSWNSVGEFFSMGGYGLYVWGSYAVTFALLGIEIMSLIAKERNTAKRLKPSLERGHTQ